MSRRVLAAFTVLMAATGAALTGPAHAAPPAPAPPAPAAAAASADVVREPLPPGFDGTAPAPLPTAVTRAEMAANAVRCEGDGVTGKRVEVLYVREAAQASRYALYAPTIRTWMANVDDAFNDSAAKTGGSRHVRFVTEAAGTGCQVVVRNVTVPNGTFTGNNWATIKAAVAAQGYNRTDRKYMVFDENSAVCGGADPDNDETPGPSSRWNLGPRYLEVGPGCWGANAAAHELGHLFGAVRDSAPHADGAGHCVEEWDLMCYGSAVSAYTCGEKDHDRLLDCGNDDYFHTNPPAGSYLATHWNSANSEFLIKGSTPDNDDGHLRGGRSYVITNAATGHALEPLNGSTAPLTEISQRPVSGAQTQRWLLNYATGWRLVNVASQLCLDDYYSQTAPGTTSLQYYCEQSNGMAWALQPVGNGRYAMINYLTGYALTSQGAHPAKLAQYPYTGDVTQQFTLTPVAESAPAAGNTYTFTSRHGTHMSVPNATVGAFVTHTAIGTATIQRWTLQAGNAAGRFRIVNAATGLCLRPETTATTAGLRLQQVTCGTGNEQNWTIRRYADTRYGFINVATGQAASLLTGAAGANVTQQPYQGGDSSGGLADRVWGLIKVS
ncbi:MULTISPECIES: RICIN domain-containing protein [Catenuloplanes]|uniref:Ricin B lectin domain-containing protein n=1 Tax=Catenuloplanes niger TaxID=587534 RepID=A0AAE3ZKV1_9ACTN|nr:RICIN domain-containing protein [Catenuloplanes niger]MDR7320480.1 hypothetical protein [Catenuloplanes niger]